MIKKLLWLGVIYVVLLTVAPDVAAVVMGIAIASIVTAIKLLGEGIRLVISQVSGQDVTNATAAIAGTVGVLLVLYFWTKRTSK